MGVWLIAQHHRLVAPALAHLTPLGVLHLAAEFDSTEVHKAHSREVEVYLRKGQQQQQPQSGPAMCPTLVARTTLLCNAISLAAEDEPPVKGRQCSVWAAANLELEQERYVRLKWLQGASTY